MSERGRFGKRPAALWRLAVGQRFASLERLHQFGSERWETRLQRGGESPLFDWELAAGHGLDQRCLRELQGIDASRQGVELAPVTMWSMNLKLPISIVVELTDDEVHAEGELDMASGEIRDVRYQDHDPAVQGFPAARDDYEFTVGILRSGGREVEFRIEADPLLGQYSVTPTELLELKGRAVRLFNQPPPRLH